ncbi:MAG: branched-chain amino acid ABC transporter ATP-binding protein/permease [Alphaproteobacteria bacterium]|nr:branched-chain amino acid ABC transporter ATP-binding protein/permease [Alphaproteobacteria bacterium]
MITAPRVHIVFSIGAIIVVILGVGVLSMLSGAASERIATVFLISLIAVTGMGIYSGNSGILSFGHLSFMAIGAYAASLLTVPARMKSATLPNLPDWLAATELSLLSAVVIAVVFAGFVALLIGLAIGRLEGSAATIATLCLLIIVHGVIIGWRDVTRGAQTFFGVPRETTIWVAAAGCIVALILARMYRDSKSGLRLRAGRENAIAARAIGINIRRERLYAWVLSAAVMALSGALMAHFLGAFSPKKFFFVDTFFLLAMLIVGGMTTITGAFTGAASITVVTEVLRRLEGGFDLGALQIPPIFGTTQIGIGLIILIAMFRKADGLAGLKEWEERVFAKKAKTPALSGAAAATAVSADSPTLDARNITRRFGGLTALDNVSIRVAPGEIAGLIGPNGSGKTTLLNILSGVLAPDAGTIMRGDRDMSAIAPHAITSFGIARTFQNIRLFPTLSVYQNVLVAAISANQSKDAERRVQFALGRLELTDLAQKDAGTLSYGDQRRVEIARALACGPSLLFLDEPAAGMNREETDRLMQTLRALRDELGIGVLLVDHDMALINQLCDRMVVLNEGRLIAEGTPAEIRKNPLVIEAYIGRTNRGKIESPVPLHGA